jgi:hypothetical protein
MTDTKAACVATLLSLAPGSQWVWTGETYDGLVWLSDLSTKPTAEQLGL